MWERSIAVELAHTDNTVCQYVSFYVPINSRGGLYGETFYLRGTGIAGANRKVCFSNCASDKISIVIE